MNIESFYPSISEELLTNAIHFTKKHTMITDQDINIIMHCRKSILFHNGSPWVKKDNEDMFDVTMGSFDGVEVCELFGRFISNVLANKYGTNNIGLHRDDGIAIFKNTTGPQSERTRKEITRCFHPPTVIEHIPAAIKPLYDKGLGSSGFNESLHYSKKNTTAPTKRNIIWFNLPYSKNVQTNIAKTFLNLIKKHFPPNHNLHSVFDKNKVKVSYSCMPNMGSIIKIRNKKILNNKLHIAKRIQL